MHSHGRVNAPDNFSRAFATGIALNVGFVAVEVIYGLQVDSLALLADAGHNLSDVAGLVLAWAGAVAGRFAPDHRHTYGWRRASILAAFANAILLLVAMGSLGWEAIARLNAPRPTGGLTIIVVAAIGVVVNGATAALFASGRSTDLNIRGAFLHMAADALVSLGVVAAGALYLWTGWGWLDPLAGLAIAVVIVIGTWKLFRQSLHLMFDGVPDSIDLEAVQDHLRSQPGVADVHDLHVWAMSTSDIALSVHLVMPGGHPGDAFLEALARALHDRFAINHPTIQIEFGGLDHGCVQPFHPAGG
ncbi:MAG: cation transporter [Betaproteobacteria bacterium RIFCSPLOWO2_12_FULL_66_14]|nr:MAG: cation transporter [Betaproteobacteria bacterium RIFCSPLOWO2_12_FULL_66_14]